MTDRCQAGQPDEQGRGGCVAYDRASRLAGELPGPARLCQWCLQPAGRDVRALVLDYRDLEQHLPPPLGVWGDGQPRGKSSPLPLRGDVLDLQREIWWLTGVWADVLRDRERLSDAPPRVRAGWAVQANVNILGPRLHVLAEIATATMWDYPGAPRLLPGRSTPTDRCSEILGWQGVLDLARLHQRARSTLGLTAALPQVIWGVQCRNIDCRYTNTLIRRPGLDEATCTECGTTLDGPALAEWTGRLSAPLCGLRNGDWWCALARRHDGDCEPARRRDAA